MKAITLNTWKTPIENSVYNTTRSGATSNAPSYGIIALYNHRFHRRGRNLSINVNINSAPSTQYQHVINDYTFGDPTCPDNQILHTDSRTTTFGTTLSYLEPIGKHDYIEFNYALSHSHTTNEKLTDIAADSAGYPIRPR